MDHFICTITAILEEKLKESIQKEITLLRELLGNFLLEESSLLRQDKPSWMKLMEDRFTLLEEIKYIRKSRGAEEKQVKDPSCDALLLRDQLLALLEKIHTQTSHNENLLANVQHLIAIPQAIAYPEKTNTVKKNTLMTLP